MPIDPSISLQAQQFDPMSSYGKALSLKSLIGQQKLQGLQIDQGEREQRDSMKLSEVFKRNLNADGSLNRQAVMRDMADGDLGYRIPSLQKQWSDEDNARADIEHKRAQTGDLSARTKGAEFDNLKKRLDAADAVITSVLARTQNPTHEDVYGAIAQAAVKFGLTAEEQSALARGLPGQPSQLRSWMIARGTEVLDAQERLKALTPQWKEFNNGKAISFQDVNPMTNPGGPSAVQMTTTPGEDLSAATSRANNAASNAVTMRGQNMADARERAAQARAPAGYRWSADGLRLEPIPGGPAAEGKTLTEGQAKANLFGSRMQDAGKVLASLEAGGVQDGGRVKAFAEGAGRVLGLGQHVLGDELSGAAGAVMNAAPAWLGGPSADQQRYAQAKRDFINAVLRRESGAAIGRDEFDSADKQYFPQAGDSPAVIKQKAQARARATELMLAEVPAGRQGAGTTAAAPATEGPASAPAAKAPRIGTTDGGYIYTGGDPGDPKSWKKVGK